MKKSVVVAAKSYTVDFTSRKIIATAEFMANAGQYGSEEYNTVMNLRKDLPEVWQEYGKTTTTRRFSVALAK